MIKFFRINDSKLLFPCLLFLLWSINAMFLKSDNLHIIHWVNGTIVSFTKLCQVRSIFFIISCKSFWENPFNWYFYYFTRMKMNTFECPKSKPTTYCTWTIRPLVDETIDPATQHIIWKIVRFLATLVYIYNTLTHRKLLPAADAYFSQSPSIKSFGGIFSN